MLVSPPARSLDLVNLAVESLEANSFEVQGIATEVDFTDDNKVIVKASAQSINHEEFGRFSEIRFTCPAEFYDRQFRCRQGHLSARHGEQGKIEARLDVTYGIGRGYSGDIRITASELLLQAIEPIWRRYSETGAGQKAVSGHVNGSLDLELLNNQPQRVASTLELQNVSVEGENVLESVNMELGLEGSRVNGTWEINSTIKATEGLMYIVPGFEVLGDRPGFYLDLNDTELELAASGHLDETRQRLSLTSFRFMHPQRLQLSGRAVFDTAANTARELILNIRADDLARVYPVYIEPLLLATNFYNLEIAGSLRLDLEYRNESLARLHLKLDDVYLDDADQRFSLSGLSTDMLLGESVHNAVSSLQWQSMSVYKLVFGAGDITMQTGGGDVNVIDWQDVDVLDGTLLINRLSLDDIGNRDFRLSLHGELTPVSLKTFTQNMGWPLLSGKLSGQIDGLEYQHGDLRVNGDFAFGVFDGKVLLEGLHIENLFNINSRLYTSIKIRDLDLEQITLPARNVEAYLSAFLRHRPLPGSLRDAVAYSLL
ncbi:MAG: hypothetical protein R3318_06060, partial [Gammaproteobacteria bacterium]|nr:hypothetical protein [Gammaproteobacteria bacterium]